jgi:L-rhamnose-H+ transport protein
MAFGFLLLILSGLFQGSFGLGYKKYSPFSWAAFWAIYSLLCMLIPILVAWSMAPDLLHIATQYQITPFLCGALWGLSAIGFSKAIDKIGMSMVYGISMGISTIVGSVTPMIMNSSFPKAEEAGFLCIGFVLTIAGVIVITAAGIKRDGGVKCSLAGILLAVLSGLGSGAMNIGFSYPLELSGYSEAAVSAVKWLPVLLGGGVMSVLWCAGELSVKHGWGSITQKGAVKRTGILLLVSIIWYSALLLYGLSTTMIGGKFISIGWILFNALALIVSVIWGIISGEWKNHSKKVLFTGCFLLITAWIFVAR